MSTGIDTSSSFLGGVRFHTVMAISILGSHYCQSFLSWAIIGPIIVSRGMVCVICIALPRRRSEKYLGIRYRRPTWLYELLFHVRRSFNERQSIRSLRFTQDALRFGQ
jgi:hypothetical protein